MSDRKPRLERRLQLDTRSRVKRMLYQGWIIRSHCPLQLQKGRQIATIEGEKVNYENVGARV